MRQTLILLALAASFPPAALHAAPPRVVETAGAYTDCTCTAVVDGELWVGTRGGGMVRLADAGPEALDTRVGLPGNRVNDCVMRQGDLYVATDSGLAMWEADSEWFEVVEWGRFLALAAAGDFLVAARDDNALLVFHGRDNPHAATVTRLDFLPLTLAAQPDGTWAAGGMDGRVLLSTGRTLRVGVPVTGLALAGGLQVLTPGGLVQPGTQGLAPVPESADAAALTPAGEVLYAPELRTVRVHAARLWRGSWVAATDEGLLQMDPGAQESGIPANWRRLDLAGCPCGPRLAALAWFDKELWVGGFDSGVCRFDGEAWHHYAGLPFLPSDMVNDMTATRSRLYIATLHGLVVVDRRHNFTHHTREQCVDDTQQPCPWYESVTGVSRDAVTGRVWVADTGSVHRLGSTRWRHYYRKRGIDSEHITRIAARDGKVAVGTARSGLRLLESGRTFRRIDDQQGLADNWVMDLAWDSAGALWVATCTRGVSRYLDGQWRHWNTASGLPDDYTLAVTPVGDSLWIGHFRGITILDGESMTHLSTRDGLAGNEVHDILAVDGRVYLATDGGLTVLSR